VAPKKRGNAQRRQFLNLALRAAVLVINIVSSDTIRFDIVGHVMLIVHADMPPDPDDWARLSRVRNANIDKLRGSLVIAPPRASINASQRADAARAMKATNASTAVVTESALIRAVTRAVGFLGIPVRAFSPSEIASALNYLVVPQSRHAEIIQRVEILKSQLALRAPQATVHKGP